MNESKRPVTVRKLPQSLYLETTNRCESKCQTCPRTFVTNEPAQDLTLDRLIKVIDQFPDLNRVVLHGLGEPLLNPEIFDIIKTLKARNIYTLFNTNAISLTPARSLKLIESGLDKLRVSVDAATPEIYKAVRGVDQFDRVVKNLLDLATQQQKLGMEHPRVSLWFATMKLNLEDLPELVRLADRISVSEVYLQRLTTTEAGRKGVGLAVGNQSLYGSLKERQQHLIEESMESARNFGIDFKASGLKDPLGSLKPEERKRPWSVCHRPWSLSYVTANGNVLPCCISACTAEDYQGAILGNAFDEDFLSIWNGERYQQFRERFETDIAPGPCEGCGSLWSV